jgi:hypothetical protein
MPDYNQIWKSASERIFSFNLRSIFKRSVENHSGRLIGLNLTVSSGDVYINDVVPTLLRSSRTNDSINSGKSDQSNPENVAHQDVSVRGLSHQRSSSFSSRGIVAGSPTSQEIPSSNPRISSGQLVASQYESPHMSRANSQVAQDVNSQHQYHAAPTSPVTSSTITRQNALTPIAAPSGTIPRSATSTTVPRTAVSSRRQRSRSMALASFQTTGFVDNRITTARYNLGSFLPKQLFEQFSKLANLYFLFIAALQQVPGWSPTGQYTTLLPLVMFVGLAMAREAYDDWLRHKRDDTENKDTAQVLLGVGTATPKWGAKLWKDIIVGDIVMVEKDKPIPADLVILCSGLDQGFCYIQTSQLDGESNLKQRQAIASIHKELSDIEKIASFRGTLRLIRTSFFNN